MCKGNTDTGSWVRAWERHGILKEQNGDIGILAHLAWSSGEVLEKANIISFIFMGVCGEGEGRGCQWDWGQSL